MLSTKRIKSFILSIVAVTQLTFPVLTFAESSKVKTNQYYQELYKKAEKLTSRANGASYKALYQQLHFYPLQPYLDQKRLIESVHINRAKEITDFLQKYQGTPLDWPLRKKWLNYLAKKNYHNLYIDVFKTNSDAKLMCYMREAQLKAGQDPAKVLPEITSLWVVGKSQPRQCDNVFKQWQQAGYRTQDVIWQRIEKAADGGKHTLIPYLTTLLEKDKQYLGELWHKVRRNPAYISKLSRFPNKSNQEAQIVAYGLKRLIWRDQTRALKTYKAAKNQFSFTKQQTIQIDERFALALATKGHSQAKSWLEKVDQSLQKGQVTQWRITHMLKNDDWNNVNKQLRSFPINQQEQMQWQYWYARSLEETEQKNQANIIYEKLAQQRHYYGFLAASRLGKSYSLNDQPLEITAQERSTIFSHAAGKRAFEFFQLGRYAMARKEWNYWQKQLTKRERLVAAKIANEAGWYDRAIFTLAYEGYLNDVDLRFPLAYQASIQEQAEKNDIPSQWAFAIARRESSFMPDAYSGAGARGLMQIMPATARHVAKRPVSSRKLNDAEQNIALGTKYLRQLYDKHDNNQVLATAAYNAGSSRIYKWLKNAPAMSADIWIETIPFKETREYVKSVMAYQQIYYDKTEKSSTLFNQLITMDIVRTD